MSIRPLHYSNPILLSFDYTAILRFRGLFAFHCFTGETRPIGLSHTQIVEHQMFLVPHNPNYPPPSHAGPDPVRGELPLGVVDEHGRAQLCESCPVLVLGHPDLRQPPQALPPPARPLEGLEEEGSDLTCVVYEPIGVAFRLDWVLVVELLGMPQPGIHPFYACMHAHTQNPLSLQHVPAGRACRRACTTASFGNKRRRGASGSRRRRPARR